MWLSRFFANVPWNRHSILLYAYIWCNEQYMIDYYYYCTLSFRSLSIPFVLSDYTRSFAIGTKILMVCDAWSSIMIFLFWYINCLLGNFFQSVTSCVLKLKIGKKLFCLTVYFLSCFKHCQLTLIKTVMWHFSVTSGLAMLLYASITLVCIKRRFLSIAMLLCII